MRSFVLFTVAVGVGAVLAAAAAYYFRSSSLEWRVARLGGDPPRNQERTRPAGDDDHETGDAARATTEQDDKPLT